jgi:hypothetical protein
MEANDIIREQILITVENQIKQNNPPEVKITIDRLIEMGYSEEESKMFIGQCIAIEIFDVIKNEKEYNRERYLKNLENLPKNPFEN